MKYLLAVVGLGLGLSQPVVAQQADAAPPWLIGCSNQADATVLTCEMSQSIVLTEGNQRLATVAFVKQAGEAPVTGVFTLPVGVFLPAGLTILVDESELGKLDFNSCDGQGCYASAPAEFDWVQAMQSGTQLSLAIARGDGEILNFGFDLTGFSEIYEVMP